jgi:hypothetical protein
MPIDWFSVIPQEEKEQELNSRWNIEANDVRIILNRQQAEILLERWPFENNSQQKGSSWEWNNTTNPDSHRAAQI